MTKKVNTLFNNYMIQTTTKRIIKAGVIGFYRNKFISLGTIFVMVITLSLIASIFFARFAIDTTLADLKEKVDINVYFTVAAPEDKIKEILLATKNLPEVAEVEYTSREDALAEFKERHKNDDLTMRALEELGENPLGAVLAIKAKDTNQYEAIAQYLEGGSQYIAANPGLIDKINYRNNKVIIDKLNIITAGVSLWGQIAAGIFIAISIMITFVTIRLAIYVFREEISVMQLVGADNLYIRGPFIVEGMLYGAFASALTMLLFWPLSAWATAHTVDYLAGISFYDYYRSHFFSLFGTVLATGVAVGAVSSFLAVRRYLK
jgi:cell division transport system permease protein